MPKAISDEEIQLRKRARRRLIGAIALVTITVVFLPMVLDSQPKPVSQDIAINIPAKGNPGNFTSKIAPLAETAQGGAVTGGAQKPEGAPAQPGSGDPLARQSRETAPAPEAQKSQPAGAEPLKQVAKAGLPAEQPAAKPVPTAESKPEPKPEAKSNGGAFVVQLDAFSNPANARQQQDKLSANGIKSYTEVVKTAKGDMTRVRVGPFPSREAAEQAREKLKKLGLDGVVAPK